MKEKKIQNGHRRPGTSLIYKEKEFSNANTLMARPMGRDQITVETAMKYPLEPKSQLLYKHQDLRGGRTNSMGAH